MKHIVSNSVKMAINVNDIELHASIGSDGYKTFQKPLDDLTVFAYNGIT